MVTHYTKGKWRFSSEYFCITVSREGIVEGSRTICDLKENVSFDYTGSEAMANGKVIAEVPNLMNLALKNYVMHQRQSNESVDYAIATNDIRCELASTIAKALGVDTQIVQEWVEQLARVKDIKINELKFQ